MDWTIVKLLDWARGYFSEKGIASPRLDAELLLAHSLGIPRVQLYVQFDRPLSEAELAAFKDLLKRRAAREPLAYITGEKEFYSMAFKVSPAVLIPRPETEELVEAVLEHLGEEGGKRPLQVLDLGTGSACILLALLKHLPLSRGLGLDASAEALAVAAVNAERHGLVERVSFRQVDMFQPWPLDLSGPFDLISANLPYVSAAEHSLLEAEVRDFEPRAALVPGTSGLELFASVLPQLKNLAAPGAYALFEHGIDQVPELLALAQQTLPEARLKPRHDLSGRPRFLEIAFS